MVWWVIGKVAAAAGKAGAAVGKAGSIAGKAGAAAGKAVGGFSKGLYKGATGAKLPTKASQVGVKGKELAKVATESGSLIKEASTATKIGHAVGKTGKAMHSAGGGGGGGGGGQSAQAKKAGYTPGTASPGIVPPYEPPQMDSNSFTETLRQKQRDKNVINTEKKVIDNPREVISYRTMQGIANKDPWMVKQGSITDILRRSSEKASKATKISKAPTEHTEATRQPTDIGVERTTGGERGIAEPTGFERSGIPESRDVKEPFWSKLVSGTGQLLTAGAPEPIRNLVGAVSPSSGYSRKQEKVEKSRDLIWEMAKDIDSEEEIDQFIKVPGYVEAFTNRLYDVNDKEDVKQHLMYQLDQKDPSFLLGHGWEAGLEPPEEGGRSIKMNIGGENVHFTPEEAAEPLYKVFDHATPPDGNPLWKMTLAEADKVADLEKIFGDEYLRKEKNEESVRKEVAFKKQYRIDNPKASKTDAYLMWAAINNDKPGMFLPTAAGNKIVVINRATGEQETIEVDKTKWNLQKIQEVDIMGRKHDVGVVYIKPPTEDGDEVERSTPMYFDEMQVEDDVADDVIDDVESGEIPPELTWKSFLPASWTKKLGEKPTKSAIRRSKGKGEKKPVKGKKKQTSVIEDMGLKPPQGTVESERVLKYLGGHGEM